MDATRIKVLFWALLVVFGFSILFPASRCSAKVYQENCGENATWTYNTKTKVLKISGKGAVTETISAGKQRIIKQKGKAPKALKSFQVKKIIVSEGITALDCANVFGGVSRMGYDPYGGLGKKAELKLPESLESIGSFSFDNWWCADITIPKNVKEIEPVAFDMHEWADCSLSVAGDSPYFCTIDGVLFSKDKKSLIYYPQNKIQKEYTVPSSVRKIAPLAFRWATHLERVILPDGLKKLGSGAFYCCTSLEYVNLSDKMKIRSITDYDTSEFHNIPGYSTSWGDYVDDEGPQIYRLKSSPYPHVPYESETRAGTFEGTLIRSIHIPNSVKYLSSNTFFNDWHTYTFTNLQEISFGKDFAGKINVGNSQSGMKTLTLNGGVGLKISIPKSNKKYCVQDGVLYSKDKSVLYFASGYQGKTLTLPKTVKKIANGAFANACTSNVYKIRHVVVQRDLESIGDNAFAGSYIKSFTCNGKINQMGKYVFSECSYLKTVKIKELKEIPECTFWDCYSLKTVNCGTKVEKIGRHAFSECSSLTEITVGNPIQSMPEHTFEDCTSLSPDAIPKSRHQQMQENLLAFRQLIQTAYKTYLPSSKGDWYEDEKMD